MTSLEHVAATPLVSLEMQRLMNPKQWGGMVLGSDPNLGPSAPRADKQSAKFALHALELCLASGMREDPFAHYLPGSTFVPGEHEAGTVVMYHQQTLLQAAPDAELVDTGKYSRRAEPQSPSELELELHDKSVIAPLPRHVFGGDAVYREEIRYGVVPPMYGRTHSRLVTINSASLNFVIPREVKGKHLKDATVDRDTACPQVERGPLPIGDTRHFSRRRPNGADSPRLVKISWLDVLAFGQIRTIPR